MACSWHSRPLYGATKKLGCELSYQRLIMLCKMYSESCFYQWVIWENLSIKIIPSSAWNKVYNNSFFTPGFLGRFGDIIPAVYHGTKGRLNKFHHLLPLIVGYRWLSLVVRESTAWVWNPANYWEPSTSGQWIKLSMLLFLYLLKVDMCCYLSHREF